MTTTDNDINRQAVNLAKHFEFTRELAKVGCSEAHLAGVATWARDANDNYERLYKACGLGNSPKVKAYQWREATFHPDATYICFGDAEELPTPAADIATGLTRTGISLQMDEIVLDGPIGYSWLTYNDPVSRVHGQAPDDPFILTEMECREFFDGVMVAEGEFRITRFDVVEYQCYRKGHTHAQASRYLKRCGAKSNFLDHFDAREPIFKRSNADYLLLSIVRDVAFSEDATRFAEHVSTSLRISADKL